MSLELRKQRSRRGILIIMSAPSGAGKTTVVKKLLEKDLNLWRSVSATTRPRRKGERHGRDYFFLSKADFLKGVRNGRFLEWARVFNHLYGTPKKPVEQIKRKGRDVILVIDVKGARKVMRKNKAFSIFLKPPSLKELARRLGSRNTDSPLEQEKRLALAREEMLQTKDYDAVVINRDLFGTVRQLRKLIGRARRDVTPAPAKRHWWAGPSSGGKAGVH